MTKDQTPPEKGKGSKLTDKMATFVDEYMIDLNASQAVLRAGYKTKAPHKMGAKLMNHPLVSAAIAERRRERQEETKLSADYVINKLVAIANKQEDESPQAALRALELLGKHLGLYRDRQEISGPDGEAIQMEQKTKENAEEFTRKILSLASKADTKLVAPAAGTLKLVKE